MQQRDQGKREQEGTKDKGRALTVGSSRISSSGSWSSATASEARLCWPPLMFCKARVLLGRSRNFIKKSTRSGRILSGRKSGLVLTKLFIVFTPSSIR
jgi:hypothetical protein